MSSSHHKAALCAVQVRSTHRLSDHGLVQSLPIAGTHVLTTCQSTGHIFVAATGSDGIHQLAPVPFDQQARALADLELFAEALTLITYAAQPQVRSMFAEWHHVFFCTVQCSRGTCGQHCFSLYLSYEIESVSIL